MSLIFDKLRVKQLAYAQAEASVFERSKRKYTHLFNPEQVEFVNDRPDALMFLTGGSERAAIECVQDFRFYLLIACKEGNSWASAVEARAWMQQHNITSILVDADNPEAAVIIEEFYYAVRSVRHLRGQKLGVVGSPSDWLVASTVSPYILHSRFGIETVDILWDDIVFDEIQQISPDFLRSFNVDGNNDQELLHSGKIYEGLASLVPFYSLNAISVECFPMVKQKGHTACLALAKLNAEGIPAACEADNVSAVGMMFVNAVCDTIPWMANTIHYSSERVTFAHCTAPLNLLSNFKIDTHFETGRGQSIAGDIQGEEVTVVRFNSVFDKVFITKAKIVARPRAKTACRTQVELAISESAAQYFSNGTFGNHHLVVPGNMTKRLELAAQLLQVEVVK